MIYRASILIVFMAIIVGSILIGGEQKEAVSLTTIDERAGDLGYAARQATIIETGADGRPLYKIEADLINEPPESGVIRAQQVRLGFRDTAGNEWTGHAQQGQVGQDSGQVELSGTVRITGMLSGSKEPANMATERLLVDTHAETVTTDQPVTLTLSGREVRARGLAAHLKEKVVQLESNVHGTYSK